MLVDVQSGTVLAEKAPDAKIYPASMTKVMTLLVAAENLPDLDATFTIDVYKRQSIAPAA